jgi:hypothetical protein
MTTCIYNGHGEGIAGVPAQDLTEDDVRKVASDWGISVDETITLLTSRGLYSSSAPQPKRTKKAEDDIQSPADTDAK